MNLDNEQFINDNKTHLTTLSHILSHTLLMLLKVSSSLISHSELLISLSRSLSLSSSSVCSTPFTGSVCSSCSFSLSLPSTSFSSTTVTSVSVSLRLSQSLFFFFLRSRLSSYFLLSALVATFSCFRFYPRFSVWGERYRPSDHY